MNADPRPPKLRRPSDIAEAGRGGGSSGSASRRDELLSWPERFATEDRDREALLVLLSLASLTPRRLLELASDAGPATACLSAVRRGKAGSESDRAFAATIRPQEVAARLREARAELITVHDPGYPPQLLDLFDPPAGVFVKGSPLHDGRRAVAIVGARNCSPSGAEIASSLARGLVGCEATVVSGGARGIDAAAHRGAVQASGNTVAVLGCGIDVAYPSQNRRLFESVLASGSIVSEYPPGTPAEPFRFPARNRLVAALAEAVVVVEGATGSGAMITAELALDLGRDVFAVPGAVTSALAEVPLALIRDGATMIRGATDLTADLGLEPWVPGEEGGEPPTAGGSVPALRGREDSVWCALAAPSAPDGLAAETGLPLHEVISALVGLEIRGLVRQVGGRYERTQRTEAGR